MKNWDLKLVVAALLFTFIALGVIEVRDAKRCALRGGVWVSDHCLRKDVVLP